MAKLFRVARPAASSWNVSKTLAQTAVFWGTLLWLVPWGIVRLENVAGISGFTIPRQTPMGWSILTGASLLGLWSGWVMSTRGSGTPFPLDTARELVTSGPYRLVRNPMAVAGLAQGLGVAVILGSRGVIVYVFAGGFLWHFLVRPLEERDLAERFGESYLSYRRRVGLWLPGVGAHCWCRGGLRSRIAEASDAPLPVRAPPFPGAVSSVRAKAVCVIRRDDAVLLIPGYDEVREVGFFLPPGGGVEFGEHSSQTVVREVMEELGVDVADPQLLGVFENIFEYRGRPEHEIIFAYSASFSDATLYERDHFEGVESDHARFVAEWVDLKSFATEENVLFPEGLLSLLCGSA